MGEWAPAVGVIGLALVIGATLVLAGPVGKALAEWIRGGWKTSSPSPSFSGAARASRWPSRRSAARWPTGSAARAPRPVAAICAPSSRNRRMRSIRSSRPCGVRWRSSPSVWTSPNGCSRRTARASGSDRVNERRREEPMEVLIPIIAVGGFFGTVIAFILSRTYLAKLKAQSQAGGAAGQEDVLAAVEELRREVAE